MHMQLLDLPSGVEREVRKYLRRVRGQRTQAERWAALSERIATYEATQYPWVGPTVRRSDLYSLIFVTTWDVMPRVVC